MSEQTEPIKHKKTSLPFWETIKAMAVHPEGILAAIGGSRPDGHPPQITLFDPQEGTALHTLEHDKGDVLSLAFAGADSLVAGHQDGHITLWDISKKKPKCTTELSLGEDAGNVVSLASSEDGNTFFAGTTNGHLASFATNNGKESGVSFATPTVGALTLAVDPTDKWVAVGGADGVIRVFSTTDGKQIREMPGHEGPIHALMVYPGDGRLISAGEDTSIRLWYLQGEVEFENRADSGGHEGPIRTMAIGPLHKDQDGEVIPPRLFTGSEDGTVKIWPLGNKRKPRTLESDRGTITALASIPLENGCYILNASEKRTLSGWKCNANTEPEAAYLTLTSALHQCKSDLDHKEQKKREKALDVLVEHLEDNEALSAILRTLQNDSHQDVRARAAEHLAQSTKRKPTRELRDALDDGHTKVRKAALASLRELQGQESLSPLTHALRSNYADTRKLAVQQLLPMTKASTQATRMINEALKDHSIEVQTAALDALETIYPSQKNNPNPKALLLAIEVGSEDLKQEALLRIHRRNWSKLPSLQETLRECLGAHGLRLGELTLELLIAGEPELAKALTERDDELDRALQELEEKAKDTPKKKKAAADSEDTETKPKAKEKKAPAGPPPTLSDDTLAPLLQAQLSSEEEISLRASTLLAHLRDLRAFGSLLQYSRNNNSTFRKEAAVALEQLHDERVLPCLEQLLSDGNADVRNAAFESLGNLRKTTLPVAKAALFSQQADIRSRGLQLLTPKKGETPEGDVLDLLKRTLSDNDEQVRNEAFKILWNAFTKTAPETCLLPALHSHQVDMRKKAMDEIISSFASAEWAKEGLLESLKDRRAPIRQAAYRTLAKIAPKGDASPHEAALQSEFHDLREQALGKLSDYKVALVRPLLLGAVKDENKELRQLALSQLLERFSKDKEALAETLDTEHWDVKLQVAHHLAALGDARALEVASDYLAEEDKLMAEHPSNDPDIAPLDALPDSVKQHIRNSRKKVIETVQTLGLPEGIDSIQSFLEDTDANIALATCEAICSCANESHIPQLQAMLNHEMASYANAAAIGLARLGIADGRSHIDAMYETACSNGQANRAVRCLAAYVALDGSQAPKLLQTTADDDQTIRRDALTVLLAHEVASANAGHSPTALTTLLATPHEDIQLDTARVLSKRANREAYIEEITSIVTKRWPKGDTKKEQASKERAVKLVDTWVAGLVSEEPTLRFTAVSLLANRDPQDFVDTLKHTFRHFKKPTLGKESKEEHQASAQEYGALALGVYVNVSRASDQTRSKEVVLRETAELVRQEQIALSVALPSLVHLLNDSSSEIRIASLHAILDLYPENAAEPFALAFKNQYGHVGLTALNTLAERTDNFAKERTIEALNAATSDVRYHAAEALQRFYDEDSLEPFIQTLGSNYGDVRLRVVDKLLRSDDVRVLEALKKALHSDHDDLRLKAAEALASREQQDAFPVLVDFLNREESRYQNRAVEAMLELKHSGTVNAIVHRIENDPEETADTNSHIQALGRLRDVSATPWLQSMLNSEEYYTRDAALDALQALTGPEKQRDEDAYIENMRVAAFSKHQNIRTRAIRSISWLKHDNIQSILASLFHDRDESIRRQAVKSATERIPEYDTNIDIFLALLNHKDSEIKFEAALLLSKHQKQEAFLTLFTAFQTSMDGNTQSRAVDGLGYLQDQRALEPLLALWAEDAEYHPAQEAAAEAIGRLYPRATSERQAEILPLLKTLLQHHSTSTKMRALKGMCAAQPAQSLSTIAQVLRQSEGWSGWQMRRECARQLAALGNTKAEDLLVKLLEDDDSDVRNAAIDALYEIFGQDALQPHLLIFDSKQVAYYSSDKRQKAAEFIAEHASPVELLARLPALVSTESQSDLFVDEIQDDSSSSDGGSDAIALLLQKGLLSRNPLPMEGLYEGLTHKDLKVRNNIVYLLAQIGDPSSAPKIREALEIIGKEWKTESSNKQERKTLWQFALWALERLDAKEGVAASTHALGDLDNPPRILSLAIQIIGATGSDAKQAQSLLEAALQHPQEKVRRQASWALSQMGVSADSILASLPEFPSAAYHLLPASDQPITLSTETLLTHTAKRELVPTLIARQQSDVFIPLTAASEPEEAQLLAINALARIANDKAVSTLDALRKDDAHKDEVRKAAYRAWRRAKRSQARA